MGDHSSDAVSRARLPSSLRAPSAGFAGRETVWARRNVQITLRCWRGARVRNVAPISCPAILTAFPSESAITFGGIPSMTRVTNS